MENLSLDLEDLFQEVKERAESEGAYSQEEWNELVEEVLDGKREFAEIDDDEDWAHLREALQSRFQDFGGEVEEM
jgi:Zn-finger domain-containing protein